MKNNVVGNIMIVSYFFILFSLITYGFLTEDSRLAWGVFSEVVMYNISYSWIQDEEAIPYQVEKLHPAMGNFIGEGNHRSGYGIGVVVNDVKSFTKYMYENSRSSNADAFRAEITFAINHGRQQKIIVEYPKK